MNWWFTARRGHTLLPAALGAFLAFLLVVQDASVVLPSLMVGSGHVVLMTFAPIPVTTGLMASLASNLPAPEVSGTRPVALLDAALAAAVIVTAAGAALVAGLLLGHPDAIAAGRNTAFLAGLMLCARPLVGKAAVMMPVAWLMLVVLVGVRPGGEPYAWTMVREPAHSPHAAVAAALVFTAGVALLLRSPRTSS